MGPARQRAQKLRGTFGSWPLCPKCATMNSVEFDGFNQWDEELDRRELEAERRKEEESLRAFYEATYPSPKTRDEHGQFLPRPGAPPRRKRRPKGTSNRARAMATWRRRAARGFPGRCVKCSRVSIPHAARGLCRACYSTVTGVWKRSSPRRIEYFREWKQAHREKCHDYSRRNRLKPEAKRKRNAGLREKRRLERRERLQILRSKLHEERRAFRKAV